MKTHLTSLRGFALAVIALPLLAACGQGPSETAIEAAQVGAWSPPPLTGTAADLPDALEERREHVGDLLLGEAGGDGHASREVERCVDPPEDRRGLGAHLGHLVRDELHVLRTEVRDRMIETGTYPEWAEEVLAPV